MTFVLYAHGHREPDVYPRDHIVKFDDAAMARVWLDRMERNLPTGYTVTSPQMDAIRAVPLVDLMLPEPYATWIPRFKYGTWDEVHTRDEPSTDQPGETKRPPRAKREAKAQRPDGYVTITELCAGSGVAACDARAILRANFDKPAFGWAFDPKQVPAIKKLIGIK